MKVTWPECRTPSMPSSVTRAPCASAVHVIMSCCLPHVVDVWRHTGTKIGTLWTVARATVSVSPGTQTFTWRISVHALNSWYHQLLPSPWRNDVTPIERRVHAEIANIRAATSASTCTKTCTTTKISWLTIQPIPYVVASANPCLIIFWKGSFKDTNLSC